jgi:hypothetical protein
MGLHSRRSRRGATICAIVVAATSLATTGAYAHWASSGTGTGVAAAGALTVQVQALVGGDVNNGTLIPGGTADAIVKVHNPHSFSVTLTSVVGNGPIVAANLCTPTGVTFTNQTALSAPIGAGTTVLLHLPGTVSMNATSAAACQGTTFSIPVTVTVRR